MTLKPDPDERDRWARFRYSIIAPLLAAPLAAGELWSSLTTLAAKTWRRLKGENRLPMVIAGIKFTDGVATTATADQRAA